MSETVASQTSILESPPSRLATLARFLGWTALFVVLLVMFTVAKLPQTKIQATLLGYVNQALNPGGIQVTADEGRLVLGLGIAYELKGVKLVKLGGLKPAILKVSRIEIQPAWSALILLKPGAKFALEEGPGSLRGQVVMRGEDLDVSFQSDGLNLGRLGALPFLAGIDGTAELKGEGSLLGNFRALNSLSGSIQLQVAKLVVDAQSLAGFNLPRIAASDGQIDLQISGGKVQFQNFRLGKSSDDLSLGVTGDVKLGRTIDSSDANLHVKLGLSQGVLKSFSILDTLLGSMKQPDGTYKIRLQGPMYSLMPTPDT